MNVNLVFEGGGVLGIYYVGAYKALTRYGYTVKKCAGTSAGSLISAIITAGYSASEMEAIICDTDFNIFNKKTGMSRIPLVGKPLSIIYNKGIYSSEIIEDWVNGLLEKKGVKTFGDLMNNGESRLKTIVADITRSKMLILPEDLDEYGINPGKFSVAKAVAMSCAIPYYFTPVKLKQKDKECFIVDGGLLSNFPIWIFDNDDPVMQLTLGVRVKDTITKTSLGKNDIISYTEDIINAPLNEDESNFIRNKDMVRTIVIDYGDEIRPTDFAKVNKCIKKMIRKGYESTARFLDKFNPSVIR